MAVLRQPTHKLDQPPTRWQLDELDALMERMLALPVDGVPEESSSIPASLVSGPDGDVSEAIMPPSTATHEETPATLSLQFSHTAKAPGEAEHLAREPASGFGRSDSDSSNSGELEIHTEVRDAEENLKLLEPAANYPVPTLRSFEPGPRTESLSEKGSDTSPNPLFLHQIEVKTLQSTAGQTSFRTDSDSRLLASDDEAEYSQASARVPVMLRPIVWTNRAYDWLTGLCGPPGLWLRGPEGRTLLGVSGIGLLAAACAMFVYLRHGWPR